jgi:hypothetical protein
MQNVDKFGLDKNFSPSMYGTMDIRALHKIGEHPLHAVMNRVGLSNEKWLPIGVIGKGEDGHHHVYLLCIQRNIHARHKGEQKDVVAFKTSLSFWEFMQYHISEFYISISEFPLGQDFVLQKEIDFGYDPIDIPASYPSVDNPWE